MKTIYLKLPLEDSGTLEIGQLGPLVPEGYEREISTFTVHYFPDHIILSCQVGPKPEPYPGDIR